MKDMLKNIVENYPEIRNEVNIIGYNVQGNLLTYLNMDTPAGYVSRIRHLRKLPYPTSQADYVSRMPALLRIAYNGFETMNSTLKKIQSCKSKLTPVIASDNDNFFPPPHHESKSDYIFKLSIKNPIKCINEVVCNTSLLFFKFMHQFLPPAY
ncbi:hypothetical protein BD770DRAFT_408704 [Pilaira anomala]|nr:hypothetical protein BD770DRAFT_408704 [Pilaira anomala]